MAEAFTAGVRPGGLTDDTQIRMLLCYLVKVAGPVKRETMQGALLQEQLGDLLFLLIGVAAFGARYTDGRLDLTVFSQRDRHAADLSGGFLAFIGDPGAADVVKR